MGLTEEQARRLEAGLKPVIRETDDDEPANEVEDATVGNEERLRGIPAVGRVSGTIKGTRPGDSSAALEQAGRDIVRSKLRQARRSPPPRPLVP